MIPIERTAAGVIGTLEKNGKPIFVGVMAYILQKEGLIDPFNLRWEIGSRSENEWWSNLNKAIDVAIRSGRVGVLKQNARDALFLAIRETNSLTREGE